MNRSSIFLEVRWTISRAADTAGYNICTIWHGRTRYACSGGGYDMLGTSFGRWLMANYAERLKSLVPYDEAYSMRTYEDYGYQPRQENYGLFCRDGNWCVDGACGLECMISLARKIGLEVKTLYSLRRNCTIGFTVTDEGA